MLKKIKNPIIFLTIAVALILIYVFFIKQDSEDTNLVSLIEAPTSPTTIAPSVDKDFLPLLLSVKNIRLDDSIFSDPAFIFLIDSNVVLTPDGNEGRPNPFASFGVENSIDVDILDEGLFSQ